MLNDGNLGGEPATIADLNPKKIKKLIEFAEKIDRKALTSAVGIMCLSWAALPIVYWLIIRKKEVKKIK